MAVNDNAVVRYCYKNRRFTNTQIRHGFRYISAVSPVRFVWDDRTPVLWRADQTLPPASAIVVLAGGHTSSLQGNSASEDAGRVIVHCDPVESIIEKLSLEATLGPFSPTPEPRAPQVTTLSGLVHELLSLLARANAVRKPQRSIDLWPDSKQFGMLLTHDIDISKRSIRGGIRLLAKRQRRQDIVALLESINASLGFQRNPYDSVSRWLELEKNLQVRSTFFVFAGSRHAHDPVYRLPSLLPWFKLIAQNGFELGLHSGINCSDGRCLSASRKALIAHSQSQVRGARPHYLSCRLPDYWLSAASSGFLYVSSLGYDNDVGFFRGLDLPFVPFDRSADAPIDIVEIPIAMMDCGLISESVGPLDDAFARATALIDKAADSGGLIVLDWHQRTLYNRDYPGWGELCLRLVRHALEKGAWSGLMTEIASRLRARMQGKS